MSEQKKNESADVKVPNPYRRCPTSSGALMRLLKTKPANRTVGDGRRLRQFILAICALTACSGEPPPDTWVGYPRLLLLREDIWRCWKLHEVGGQVVFLRTGGNDSSGVAGTGSGPPKEWPEVQVLMVPVERNDSIYTPSRDIRLLNYVERELAAGAHEDSLNEALRQSVSPFKTVADLRAHVETKFPSSMRRGVLGATHVIHRSTGSLYFYDDDDYDADDPEAGIPSWHTYTAYRNACPDPLAEEAMERIRAGG